MNIASASASAGWVRDRPVEILDLLDHAPVAPHAQDDGEGADIHEEIDRHVDEDAAHARWAAGGEADQGIADMADGAVGHQPLDVVLIDGGEGAQHHRGDGDEPDDLAPFQR